MKRSLTEKWLVLILAIALGGMSCGRNNAAKKEKTFPKRDKSITPQNAYSELFLDSMQVELYITNSHSDSATARNLRGFYNSRNYQYAWFGKKGLNEPATSFWNLLNSYVNLSKDSSLLDTVLVGRMAEFMDGDTLQPVRTNLMMETDLALTRQFFAYARTAYAGKLEPADLQWFIPRKKVDALALLDTLISRKGSDSEMWEPLNPMYQALKKKLLLFNKVADQGGWQPIVIEAKKTYHPGDSSAVIVSVRHRLFLTGDVAEMDSSAVYDSTLYTSVKKLQKSYGLKENGIIDNALAGALNIPAKQRIEQMLVNLERMRWLPEKPAPDKIIVNIPEFVIHVFEQNKQVFDMRIVVGKSGSSTVIFNDLLKFVVFSPYWNVPRSIVKNEIMPAMKRNSGYLARNNMEMTGKSGGLPVIRQKPGGRNALGRVKFLFPNNYNIYFHDTPAKDLFNRDKRAFSHGCIRLADAEKMAVYLLRDQPEWTADKIKEAMNQSKEKWVTLKNPIPVYITYFTAWVDDEGTLNFRDDIYGHDKKMAEQLFLHPLTAAN